VEIKDLTGRVIASIGRHPDLMQQDLRFVGSLVGADFNRASVVQANFEGLDCRGSSFVGARLWGSNFRGADLSLCDFRGADVSHCDFSRACLLYTRGSGENENRWERGLGRTIKRRAWIRSHWLSLKTRTTKRFDHVRIQNFRDSRRYAFHLRSALEEVCIG
jgi:Pentapeptide repeats (8 copies)